MTLDVSDRTLLLDGRYLVYATDLAGAGPHAARDTRFSRDVVVHLWPDDEAGRTAWRKEVVALTARRRGVPHLLDAGTDEGRCWLVLPPQQAPQPLRPMPPVPTPTRRPRPAARARGRIRPAVDTDRAPVLRGMALGAGMTALVGAAFVGLRADAGPSLPATTDAREAAVPASTSGPAAPAAGVRVQAVADLEPAADTTRARVAADDSTPERAARRPVGLASPAPSAGRGRHVKQAHDPRADGPRKQHAGPGRPHPPRP